MFYCEDCAEMNGWEKLGRRLECPCEVCGKERICYDRETPVAPEQMVAKPAVPVFQHMAKEPGPDGWLDDSILYAKGLCWIPCQSCGEAIGYMHLPQFPEQQDRRAVGPFYCKECGEKL